MPSRRVRGCRVTPAGPPPGPCILHGTQWQTARSSPGGAEAGISAFGLGQMINLVKFDSGQR